MIQTSVKAKEVKIEGKLYKAKEGKWIDLGVLNRRRSGVKGLLDFFIFEIYKPLRHKCGIIRKELNIQ